MINNLRKTIAGYMMKYCDIDSWKDIRQSYSVYSYISFLVLIINNMKLPVEDLKKTAIETGIEKAEILDYVLSAPGAMNLIIDIMSFASKDYKEDIDILYQDFLSVDYAVKDGKIVFESGKNNRDTLGSYYTQEDFAFEIVKKAIDEYVMGKKGFVKKIRIADFSCGGGVFLAVAQKYCAEINIDTELIGSDVDPIAVMITRARLYNKSQIVNNQIKIVLGNPLLLDSNMNDSMENFIKAIYGRYYNHCMGVNIEGKYDIVIGNPPWEKIRFEEKKFLLHYVKADAIDTKQNRNNTLNLVSKNNALFYNSIMKDYEMAKKQIKRNASFSYTNCGELNTYALFAEYALNMLNKDGVIGLIVKSSLVKMPVYSAFMKMITESKKISEIYMFVNRNRIFNIDSREEFSVIYLKEKNNEPLKIVANLDEYRDFYKKEKISLSKETIKLLNPDTGMLPNIHNNKELQFLCRIYSQNAIFEEEYNECRFGRLVHLTNHSQYIVKESQDGYLPIYEGKFIELYTGKYATFHGMSPAEKYKNKAIARPIKNINKVEYPESRYFIKQDVWSNISKGFSGQYIVAWRSLTSATNRRTMLATILPLLPTCQSIQMLQIDNVQRMLHILALFNSIVFDYIVRLKIAGLDLTQAIIKQIPVPSENAYYNRIVFYEKEATINQHINSRLCILYKDDNRVYDLFAGQDYYIIDKDMERKKVIAELDVLIGMLYGLTESEVKEIASTFDKYYYKEELGNWF